MRSPSAEGEEGGGPTERPAGAGFRLEDGVLAVLTTFVVVAAFGFVTAAHIVWLNAPVVGWWVGLRVRNRAPGTRRPGLLAAGLALLCGLFASVLSPWGALWGQTLHRALLPASGEDALRLLRGSWHPAHALAWAVAALLAWSLAARPVRPIQRVKRDRRPELVLAGLVGFTLLLVGWQATSPAVASLAFAEEDGALVARAVTGVAPFSDRLAGHVTFWPRGERRGRPGPGGVFGPMTLGPDGGWLAYQASARPGENVRVWEFPNGRAPHGLAGRLKGSSALAFSRDGRYRAAGSPDGVIELSDRKGPGAVVILRDPDAVTQLHFSPCGERLASVCADGTITIRDTLAGAVVSSWPAFPRHGRLRALAFGDGCRTLYTAGGLSRTVRAWCVATGTPAGSFAMDVDWITSLAAPRGGELLAVGGGSFHRGGSVVLVALPSGDEWQRLAVRADTVTAVAFSPDGETVAAGSAPPINPFRAAGDQRVHRWLVVTGQELPALE